MTVHVRRCDTWVSKHSGDALPGVEVKDADVFVGAAGGHVLTRRIELNLPGRKKRESLSDALIIYCRWGEKARRVCRKTLPWADCRPHSGTPCRVSSVCRCWCWKSWKSQTGKKSNNPQNVFQRRLIDLSETRTRSHALTWCSGPDSPQRHTCRWGPHPCRTGWSCSPCGGNAGTRFLFQSVKQTKNCI